jgi:hypothetical protein
MAADAPESHGKDRRDHGEGREDSWIADFIHGFDGHLG